MTTRIRDKRRIQAYIVSFHDGVELLSFGKTASIARVAAEHLRVISGSMSDRELSAVKVTRAPSRDQEA